MRKLPTAIYLKNKWELLGKSNEINAESYGSAFSFPKGGIEY